MSYGGLDGKPTSYPDLPKDEIYPMFAPTENLIDAVTGDAPNRSPAELGLNAMKVIEASCQSARTNSNICIA